MRGWASWGRLRKTFACVAVAAFAAAFVFPWIVSIPARLQLGALVLSVLLAPGLLTASWTGRLIVLILALVVGPLLLPLGEIPGTAPASRVASGEPGELLELSGVRTWVRDDGSGAPALLFFHPGAPLESTTWNQVWDRLGSRYRVVAFDRPGAGLTAGRDTRDSEHDPYSTEGQADLAIAVLDHLGIEEAVLVGNSAGGTVALVTALRHPERFRGLVLVAPGVYFGAANGVPAWMRWLVTYEPGHRLARLAARAVGRPGPSLWDTFWADPERFAGEPGYYRTYRVENWDVGFVEMLRTARFQNLPARLSQIPVPVLVVGGIEDQWVPRDDNRRLAEELPDARLVELEDCGHLPQQEKPDEFLEALTGFLEESVSRSESAAPPSN